MILVLNILQNLVVMDVKLITAIVLLSVRLVILTTAVTELLLVALMDVQVITLTVLLSARLVILITAATELPLFLLVQAMQRVLIFQIVLQKLVLGAVNLVILNQEAVVKRILLVVMVGITLLLSDIIIVKLLVIMV